ncbi:MAG TPA: universal stress protein [Gemmatimonadaceae bacterium]|nr:universal stress protein [Gemmatimonadaceae bacterium]
MRLLMLRTILVATDLTPASAKAIDTARRLAEASGAKLRVVHVRVPAAFGEARIDADDLARQAGLTPGKRLVDILSGDPAAEISTLANGIGADLIVLGHHRESGRPEGAPVGSTAYAVITRTEAPCLVVSRPLDLPLRRALVATDFSEAARGALLAALSWTSALRSRAPAHPEPMLVALHVESSPLDANCVNQDSEELTRELESLKRSAGEWSGVQVHGLTRSGTDPARCIVECAREEGVELVVMGTHARTTGRRTGLGSISDAVIRAQDIPVLLVPPAVWRDYARDLDAA